MTLRKAGIEHLHESLFLTALASALRHLRVEIPDIPAIGDGKMTRIGPPIDQDDAVFSEQTVIAAIIDKARRKEQVFRMFAEIALDRADVVKLCKAFAGMRTARSHNDGKGKIGGGAERTEAGWDTLKKST